MQGRRGGEGCVTAKREAGHASAKRGRWACDREGGRGNTKRGREVCEREGGERVRGACIRKEGETGMRARRGGEVVKGMV